MIEAYMNATLEVLRLAGQMFLQRIDYELRRFAEDLHDFIYDLDRNPRRDWRERFDAFLADQSSRGRDISPESRLDLIAYLEVWERNVYGGAVQRSLEAVITRVQEPVAVPAATTSGYSVLPPRRPAEPKPPKRKPSWWRPPTGDRADFYRKLNDARSCIYDLERMLPAIANRIEAAQPDVPLEIDDELNAVEWLIWRHNDLMESAREIWLTKNLGQHEFTELDLGPNPASLGLPLFTDDQQAARAKEQLKQIGARIKQKIAFLDDVIFAMKAIETAGNVASVLIGGLVIKAAWHGGKMVLVKTVVKLAASVAASAAIGKATEAVLEELGVEEETVEKVSNAVELISWLLVLRRMKLLKARGRSRSDRKASPGYDEDLPTSEGSPHVERPPSNQSPPTVDHSPGTGLVPAAPVELGKWGEARLRVYFGGKGFKPAKAYVTRLGKRYVDWVVGRVAHEAKAGINVKLTASIKEQALKDAELVSKGIFEEAHWHFFQGADRALLQYLTSLGIRFTVH